jgi:phosphatidylglycerophosphate synthase
MAPDPDDRDRFDPAARRLAVCMLSGLIASLVLERSEPLAVVGLSSLGATFATLWRIERPKVVLPTLITSLRIVITAGIGFAGPALTGRQIALGMLVVFLLDGLDGMIARRLNGVSRLGAELDGEGDAFLVAVACVLSWLTLPIGAWILVPGFLRYVYVLTVAFVPSRGRAPASRLASRAFGVAFSGFLLGFLGWGSVSRFAPLVSTLVLSWSFSRSFYWSLRKA